MVMFGKEAGATEMFIMAGEQRRAAALDEPLHPKLEALLDYWQKIRGGRKMPRRADVDPIDIPALLPHVVLVQVGEKPCRFFIRLAGSALRDVYGFEITGRCLNDIDIGTWRNYWARQGERVVSNRAPLHGRKRLYDGHGRPVLGEWLLLPLSEDDADVNMILAALVLIED